MTLKDYYELSIKKKEKTVTDLLVIEVYEKLKKIGGKTNDNIK